MLAKTPIENHPDGFLKLKFVGKHHEEEDVLAITYVSNGFWARWGIEKASVSDNFGHMLKQILNNSELAKEITSKILEIEESEILEFTLISTQIDFFKAGADEYFVYAKQRAVKNSSVFLQDFSDLMVECTSLIVQSSDEDFHQKMDLTLGMIGRFAGVDRAYFFKFNKEDKTCSNINEWCNEGVEAQIQDLQDLPEDLLPMWMSNMKEGKEVYIDDMEVLDENWAAEKGFLESQSIKSLLSLPIREGGELLGFLGFDAVKEKIKWPNHSRQLLSIMADNTGSVIRRRLQNQELKERTYKSELLASEADRANRAKSEFLANMSHELRTPLNGVIGFGELLKTTRLDNLQKTYVDYMHESASILLDLINDILDFSKIEAGKMEIHSEPFNLTALIDSAITLAKPQAELKKLKLWVNIDSQLPKNILSDYTKLLQVLNNLLTNAVKFTEKGSVKFEISKEGIEADGKILLKFGITDTGIGITDEQKKSILKVFGQGDASTAKKYGGSGLGLAISNNLLKLMSSYIQYESKAGEGSYFYFFLPVTEIPDETPNARTIDENIMTKAPKLTGDKNESILIVEDNELNSFVAGKMLSEIYPEWSIQIVSGGSEAIAFIGKNPDTAIILMDIQMPGMDGRLASAELRASGYMGKIIACTANAISGEREKCLESGMDDYISKPFTRATLKETIERNR